MNARSAEDRPDPTAVPGSTSDRNGGPGKNTTPSAPTDGHPADPVFEDDALLAALGRGELPARFRADVTARLSTVSPPDAEPPPPHRAGPTPSAGRGVPGPVGRSTPSSEAPSPDPPGRRSGSPAGGPPGVASHRAPSPEALSSGAPSPEALPPEAPSPGTPSSEAPSSEALPWVDAWVAPGRVRGGRHRAPRRADRFLIVAAGVAAIAAVGSAGSVAAASSAEPGDPLWPITQVVYTERAASLQARADGRAALAQAREAVVRGDDDEARRCLREAITAAGKVRADDGRDELVSQTAEVRRRLTERSRRPRPEPSPSAPSPEHGDPVIPEPTETVPTPTPVPPASAEPTPSDSGPEPSGPDEGTSASPTPTEGVPTPSATPTPEE